MIEVFNEEFKNKAKEKLVEEKIFQADDCKPCPFCGSKEIYIEYYKTNVGMRYRILCGNCCAGIFNNISQSQHSIKEAWNRRVG